MSELGLPPEKPDNSLARLREQIERASKVNVDVLYDALQSEMSDVLRTLKEKKKIFEEISAEKTQVEVSGVTKIWDFEIIKVLSRGAFGTVFMVRKFTSKDIFAMKVMQKKEIKAKKMEERVLNERKIMSLLGKENNFVVQVNALLICNWHTIPFYPCLSFVLSLSLSFFLSFFLSFNLSLVNLYISLSLLSLPPFLSLTDFFDMLSFPSIYIFSCSFSLLFGARNAYFWSWNMFEVVTFTPCCSVTNE